MYINESMNFIDICSRGLTLRNHYGTLPLAILRNQRRKETHGNGGTENPLPSTRRMDGTYAQEKQGDAICIRIQEKGGQSAKSILCSFIKSRTNGTGSSSRKTEVDQKIKPAWQLATIENSAAGQFLTVWTTSRNAPRNSLLILIIQNLARICKVRYEKGMGMR